MHWSNPRVNTQITALAFASLLATLWLLMRGYHGLTGDGQIYAFQALARIHPQLTTDLYLQNTSQDRYTIFSPLYAWFIGLLGLENATRLLTMLFTAWLLTAAWSVAGKLAGRHAAWLAVAFLLIIDGNYGGAGVFRLSEQFLTARLPAEALSVTALACYIHGRERLGLLLATGTLFIHPLIALPGLFLLICMWLPHRAGLLGAILGILATFAIAIIAAVAPLASHVLPTMDAAWLEVVKERSQFLFLQLWSVHDWSVNAQPFVYLAFTAIAVPDVRIRNLCMAAAVVGAVGLAVAVIGGLMGPVAILVQGQAWRWVWVTVFVSALLLPATALQVWQDRQFGPLCVVLLVSGWTLSAVDGTACASAALILWVARANIDVRLAGCFRWVAAALGLAILAWIFIKSWPIVSRATSPSGHVTLGALQIREIFGLKISALIFWGLAWRWLQSSRTLWEPTIFCLMVAVLSIFIWPAAFKQSRAYTAVSDVGEFADWINVIPPASTVLVVPPQDVGAFVWFTLGRPNYLAVDQSAGVVFSRATAVEVKRRSEVLLPLMDPNWKMLTSLRTPPGSKHKDVGSTRPLTALSLIQVCSDPQLGFVISPKDVGFNPLRHEHAGVWKDWNLYDCRKVRSALPST